MLRDFARRMTPLTWQNLKRLMRQKTQQSQGIKNYRDYDRLRYCVPVVDKRYEGQWAGQIQWNE